jgi:hypothetical protein
LAPSRRTRALIREPYISHEVAVRLAI